MHKKISRISSLAWLIILDGLRRHALLGLFLFALACEMGGMFFFDFIPRDIGRATNDFLFSIGWLAGFIFLLFHCTYISAWDDEHRTIHIFLTRPISRTEYVIAVFSGLAILLFALNSILGGTAWVVLNLIKKTVDHTYFPNLSLIYFLLAWAGLYFIEMTMLSVIMFFSGSVRGSFPVLLLTISYYFICSGLPVILQTFKQNIYTGHILTILLTGMTAFFPDFTQLDFKTLAASNDVAPSVTQIVLPFLVSIFYIIITLCLTSLIYERRDLQ